MFAWWGHVVYRFRWVVLGLSALLLVGSIVALGHGGTLKNSGGDNTESGRALTLMQHQLPQSGAGSSFSLVFGSDAMAVSDPAFRQAMLDALQPLRSDARVKSIETPFDVQPDLAHALTSTDGHHAMAVVSLKDDYATARQYYPQLRAKVTSVHLRIYGTGNVAVGHDFDTYLAADLRRAELVSLVIIVPLLLIVFATVISMLLPLGVGGLAVLGGLAAVGLLARLTDVSTYATNIVTLIGLGVAIDYSLFIVNRFREELAADQTVESALATAIRTSGRAVTFSGITVAIGLSAMLFFQGSFLASMGTAGAIVVAVAVLYALTFLSALLAVLGHRVNWLRLPVRQRRAGHQAVLSPPASAQPARFQEFVHSTTGPNIVTLTAVTKQAAESDGSRAIVRALRGLTPPAGSSILVAAFSIDFTDFIMQRIPLAVAYVMLVTYLVLFLLTGSVVLPLKAVVMNVVSIGASFGALVWIFQQGHLSSLLNFTAAPLDPSVPVLLFCIVFGLSMDYEVLLISRIQEEYRRSGDTRLAVAEGLERSGRLITGAAAIMFAVFLAFGLADVVLIKSIGLGLAIAVAIDATLVRALIVPAVMRLLGRANWWAPRRLARLHRRITLEEPVAA